VLVVCAVIMYTVAPEAGALFVDTAAELGAAVAGEVAAELGVEVGERLDVAEGCGAVLAARLFTAGEELAEGLADGTAAVVVGEADGIADAGVVGAALGAASVVAKTVGSASAATSALSVEVAWSLVEATGVAAEQPATSGVVRKHAG
jgi:hypothetical protein